MNLKEKSIVIDNKTYRYSKIVMLDSDNKSVFKGQLVIGAGNHLFSSRKSSNIGALTAQHLYFLSTDKICEGDWFILTINNGSVGSPHHTIAKMLNFNYNIEEDTFLALDIDGTEFSCGKFPTKKIVASTDLSLSLPKPSESFIKAYIEAYNKNEKIEECLIEYININNYSDINRLEDFEYFVPKATKGEITTRKIKDNFTLEELENALVAHYLDISSTKGCNLGEDVRIWTKKWIEQNL